MNRSIHWTLYSMLAVFAASAAMPGCSSPPIPDSVPTDKLPAQVTDQQWLTLTLVDPNAGATSSSASTSRSLGLLGYPSQRRVAQGATGDSDHCKEAQSEAGVKDVAGGAGCCQIKGDLRIKVVGDQVQYQGNEGRYHNWGYGEKHCVQIQPTRQILLEDGYDGCVCHHDSGIRQGGAEGTCDGSEMSFGSGNVGKLFNASWREIQFKICEKRRPPCESANGPLKCIDPIVFIDRKGSGGS